MLREKRPQKTPSFDFILWVQWVLATTLGWAVGWIISEFAVGVTVGLAQWIVLRKRIEHPELWVLASGIGWAAGRGLVVAVLPSQATVLAGGIIGAALGLAQWLVLRQRVVKSWWWIIVSGLGWAVGLTAFLGVPLVGSIVGAATGLALEPLLRYSSLQSEEEAI
jgi:hypothetical protein